MFQTTLVIQSCIKLTWNQLLNKRTTHSAYIKHSQEEAAILRDLVDHIKANYPLDPLLEYACKYTKLIQEMLSKISKTCPCINSSGEQLVAVTPVNKVKSVRFTSSRNTKTAHTSNLVSNKPMLSSTGVKQSTSSSGSQPSGNTKKDKIQQTQSRILKNKVKAHSRKHSKLNANYELKYVKCNGCMLSDNHDLCVLDFINNVNAQLNLDLQCALGKSLKKPHKPKSEDTNQEKLYLLHMDLCGLMRVVSVNGKKYILVIVDDYSRFTWVKCLRSKDEAPIFIINFLKMIQVRLKETVRRIRTDNGTEFVNQTLREYYEKVGISHETSVARSPQQNGVVERRNRTLIEAARTMLIYAKAPLFLWAEAVATACYTQNRSMIRRRHGKTPYELLHDKPPDLSYLHVFGALCYPTNDCENLGKLQPKADIGIFIGYAPTKKAFRIYNRRTRRIIETIHVDFDELTAMASEHSSSGPALHEMTPVTISSGLVPNPPSSTPFVPPSRSDWDLLFQPMFDESLNPQPYVDLQAPEVIAPIPEAVAPEHAVSTGSPSSTTVDQDAPSSRHPLINLHHRILFIQLCTLDHQILNTIEMTKDITEIISGELARPFSSAANLHEQLFFVTSDAFSLLLKPKIYNDALTSSLLD
ncbi:retrovirus-related pol polyprotein from transposon TNT 1-94 [Tanacetum coccineum]